MNFNKALSILGLNPNFTEEELKKAHRKLTIANHPDKHQDNSEMNEKQTQINAARDFLISYAKKEISPQKNGFNINDYIQEKIKILENILSGYNSTIKEESYQEAYKIITGYINVFKTDVFISYVLTKTDVDESYNTTIFFIKSEYRKFEESFYQKYNIDKSEIKETLNYDCSLKYFYEQLLNIEKKYGKETKIKQKLEEELKKYQEYEGYQDVYQLIMKYQNKALTEIRKKHFKDIEKEIFKMHQNIESEVFSKYYSIKESIANLEDTISTINDQQIHKEYEQLRYLFQKCTDFSDMETKLSIIEYLIEEHNQLIAKQQEFKQNEKEIGLIYKSLIEKFSLVLKQYNPVTDYEIIVMHSEILTEVIKLFNIGCTKFKDLNYFNIFTYLTFKDDNKDAEIVETIIEELNKSKKQKSK